MPARPLICPTLSCRGVPTNDERPVLDYAPPQGQSRAATIAKAASARAVLAVCLFVAAVFVPHPQGIWYFGHRPQWTVAIDSAGLTIGRYPDPMSLGWVPLLVLKLIVVAVPVWIVWRFRVRARRNRSAAG